MATHSSILCLENLTDRGAWHATVHAAKESAQPSDSHSEITQGGEVGGQGRAFRFRD